MVPDHQAAGPQRPSGTPSGINREAVAQAVRLILQAVGEDPERPGLRATPERVARAYAELFAGVGQDPGAELEVFQEDIPEQLVVVKDIPFYSLCEHHLLPFLGKAHVAYLSKEGRITGLSNLAAAVEIAARRLQLQERLTAQVADAVMERLVPWGVIVVLEAEHLCMTMRGLKKAGAKTVTSAARGVFVTDSARRTEVLTLLLPHN